MRGCETGGEGKKRDGEGICDGTGIETHFFAINNVEYERARERERKKMSVKARKEKNTSHHIDAKRSIDFRSNKICFIFLSSRHTTVWMSDRTSSRYFEFLKQYLLIYLQKEEEVYHNRERRRENESRLFF